MLFQIIISGLVIGSVYGLIALGYSLIYKSSGLMSFVQGDMLTFGAFLGYTFYGVLGIPFFISFFMVIFLMFLLGFAIEKGVIHRLVAKGVNPINTVLATIAIYYIIQNGSMVLFGSDIKYFPPVTSIKNIKILSLSVQTEAALCIIASVIFMILFNFFMNKTSTERPCGAPPWTQWRQGPAASTSGLPPVFPGPSPPVSPVLPGC